MSKYCIIVFEGVDGSGKTYHIDKVKKYFKKKKLKFISIREPGGSKNSELIRKILLSKKNNFNKITDLFLYMASRNENIELINKYKKIKIILIDRFTDSTIAYQHFGQKINLKLINTLNKFVIKNTKISHTFLHLVNKKNLKLRLKSKKKNRYDNFNINFYHKIQLGYLKLSKLNKKKYSLIDSNLSKKVNEKIIIDKINKIIEKC